ncbi:MAG: hypothetical protein R2771_02045 [Saprospiraceae bacterium]
MKSQVIAYPNPTNSMLYIDINGKENKATVEILDNIVEKAVREINA